MPLNPHQVYAKYLEDPGQDMVEYQHILRSNATGNILEIGTRWGVSTASFLVGLEERGGHLYSVDLKEQCRELYVHPQWTFICSDSLNSCFVKAQIPKQLDVLFVDGDHSFWACWSDLRNYGPMVREGGTIFVHDVTPPKERITPEMVAQGYPYDGPERAVARYLEEFKGKVESYEVLPGTWGMGVIKHK